MINKELIFLAMIIVLVLFVGYSKEIPIDKDLGNGSECIKKAHTYFKDDLNTTFLAVFNKPSSKEKIEVFLIKNKINYEFHTEFPTHFKYFIYLDSQDGPKKFCMLNFSNLNIFIAPIGGEGGAYE